ncbi:MAG: acyl carrier protein [Lachnospiraceae bacterium]
MTNLEKYNKIFMESLRVKEEELANLNYRGIPNWDSIGHMELMSELEEKFDVQISTIDVLDFTSYEKGKEVLAKYNVII